MKDVYWPNKIKTKMSRGCKDRATGARFVVAVGAAWLIHVTLRLQSTDYMTRRQMTT
jgi:hypothetical protein